MNIYITDEVNRVILPKHPTQATRDGFYDLIGYHENKKELILVDRGSAQVYGYKGMPLKVWYGEDLLQQSEQDNSGTSCADVYAMVD